MGAEMLRVLVLYLKCGKDDESLKQCAGATNLAYASNGRAAHNHRSFSGKTLQRPMPRIRCQQA